MSHKNKCKILIVDDDPHVLKALVDLFKNTYDVTTASSGKEALELAGTIRDLAVVVMDIKMPEMDGIEAGRIIRQNYPKIRLIFHTGYPGEYDDAELDKQICPYDYIIKGRSSTELRRSVRNAARSYQIEKNPMSLVEEMEFVHGIIGRSERIREVFKLIKKANDLESPVMICGENGVGKELVARAIHRRSRRQKKALVVLNCGHNEPAEIETELFGVCDGAHTNVRARKGILEYANFGTVFLDEIGDIHITTQVKLLRVIEDGSFCRVGSSDAQRVDMRIISATRKDIKKMVKNGKFREDLYHRLNGITIDIPPLRNRSEDIEILSNWFINNFALDNLLHPKIIDSAAIKILIGHKWDGNVGELFHKLESMMIACESDLIIAEDVEWALNLCETSRLAGSKDLSLLLKEFERTVIIQALSEANYVVTSAAANLGMSRDNLSHRLRKHGINVSLLRKSP